MFDKFVCDHLNVHAPFTLIFILFIIVFMIHIYDCNLHIIIIIIQLNKNFHVNLIIKNKSTPILNHTYIVNIVAYIYLLSVYMHVLLRPSNWISRLHMTPMMTVQELFDYCDQIADRDNNLKNLNPTYIPTHFF